MRTESNATKVDLNDPSPARRASLSSTDERGAPLKRAATSRLNHHRETLTSPSVLRSSQAAVVGAATVLMASPAFAATIKLGGDNGELGFFVSAPYRRSHSRRTRVRPRPIAAASKSGCHSAEIHLDTSASGRRASLLGASRFLFGVAAPSSARFSASCFFRRKHEAKKLTSLAPLHSNDSPTRSPSPRVRPSSS